MEAYFFVLYGEGHEVHTLVGLFGGADGGQKHGVAHTYLHRAVGLLGQLASLYRNLAAISQFNGFFNRVKHKFFLIFSFFVNSRKGTENF